MDMKYQFSRDRSEFWIIIYDNDTSYSISTNSKYIGIINFFFPILEIQSPTKWKESETYSDMHSLWLPKDCCEQITLNRFMEWCQHVTQDILWVYLSKNISQYFCDELDFCIASDFNYVYGNGRTEIGEAEYQLKYNNDSISAEDREKYADFLLERMLGNCQYIPIGNRADWFVSPMPSTREGKQKLAWLLAEEIAVQLDISFLDSTLNCNKPQMKELSVDEKIEVWEEIYRNECVEISNNIYGKNVLIIDDLYQSGTTMWQYARFLKGLGAIRVFGVVCVKSLKDSDNR